jgi:serine/threonine protein kinase/tetratricopeptide (TPR) repeat protein
MTTPGRWQEIDRIFAEALEREPGERAIFLDGACGGDEQLRAEVESLLAHNVPESLVDGPAVEETMRLLANENMRVPKLTAIGPYQIVRLLGSGGMGLVYLAHDPRLNRQVAVKLLSHYSAVEEERIRRFRKEAFSASALNHPNILTIFEIGDFEGQNFIATEFVDGVTLRAHLGRRELPISEGLEIAIQIASALSAAHEAEIVHRDIKPENVMIRPDCLVKVLDFGIAKYTQAEGGEEQHPVDTKPGSVIGTAPYMSPEQARGLSVEARTDIWSLGVLLYEMVTGRLPFLGETVPETLSLILQKEPAPLARYAHDVPAELERIITKALTKDREERYQTAKDLLIDLRNLKRKSEVDAEIERTVAPEHRRQQSTSGSASTAATASGAVAATGPAQTEHSPSSAAHIVSGIKQHKLAATLALVVLIVGGVVLWAFLRARNPEVVIDSIAVLPFQNKSTEGDTEYLSDGLAESLLYRLSQLPNLKVSPTSSVSRYKGKEIDPVKVGQELGVNAVLSGRIVQRGENLTISVELLDVRNNRLLWGEQYDRKMSDLLQTQREIAQEIVEKLRLKVSGEQKRLAKHDTESSEAYQLYLKGRFHWNKRTGAALKKAIEYFNQAIEKDPNFALAYAGLADCYVVPGNPQSPGERMPKAKAAAIRALELDETLAEAHTSLGRVLATYDWDRKSAEKEYKRAIELNPRSAIAHLWYSGCLEVMGRNSEALAEKKEALELDPLSVTANFALGFTLYCARDYDGAIEQFQKTLELDQNFPAAHIFLPAVYEQKGMYDKAIAEYKTAILLKGGGEWAEAMAGLGHVYALSGRKSEARTVLAELKQLSGQQHVPASAIALIYLGLNEKDQAIAWLEKGFEERSFQMQWLAVEPRWDSLRSDPRFAELIHRMGLPQ